MFQQHYYSVISHQSSHHMNMMATRRRKRPFPLKPLLLPQRHLLAGLAVAFAVTLLFIVLVLLSTPPSSAPSRFVDTRSPSTHSSHCGVTSLGEFGDMMVSMLPKNLAFTVFVPSPESFRRVLKLRPNDSVAEGKASHTYAIVSRVLGFSAVPRRLCAVDVPLHERVRRGRAAARAGAPPGLGVWTEDLCLEGRGRGSRRQRRAVGVRRYHQ